MTQAQKAKNTVVTFGKYAGKTLEEVYQQNWKYLSWLVDEQVVRGGVDWWMLAQDVLEAHDDEDAEKEAVRKCW